MSSRCEDERDLQYISDNPSVRTHRNDWDAHQTEQLFAVLVVIARDSDQTLRKLVDVSLVVCLSSHFELRLGLGALCRTLCELMEQRQSPTIAIREPP